MAILTLNIYSATFFLVWATPDNICLVGKDHTFSDNLKKTVKIITVCLPFSVCPLTLYIAGQAKALQHDQRGMGCVAGLVIIECIYILFLGALMTVCMSERSYKAVGAVTAVLVVLLVVTWGCCCYHPKVKEHISVHFYFCFL